MKKVLSLTASLVIAFIAHSMVGGPVQSQAADLSTGLRVVRNAKVFWVQAELPALDARRVRIDLLTPSLDGERRRWQFCQMDYVGLGTYRCGLDVDSSTPVRTMDGTWLASFKVDGTTTSKVTFRTTR